MKLVLTVLFFNVCSNISIFIYDFWDVPKCKWVLWIQLTTSTLVVMSFNTIMLAATLKKKYAKLAQNEAKVLVTNDNSKIVCIQIEL